MPAKKLIEKQNIVCAALDILRENSMNAVNARNIAKRLGCSTQPIYFCFKSMDELKESVSDEIKARYNLYLQNEINSGKYPLHKAHGMGYIRFAKEEKEMFKYMFMRQRASDEMVDEAQDVTENIIQIISESTHLSREKAQLFHAQLWIHIHGIATMLATSYYDWSEKDVNDLVSDCYFALLTKYKAEENI